MYDLFQISVVDLISIVFIPIIICPIHYILHKLFFVVVENITPTTVANFPQIPQKSNELVIRLFLTLNKNIYKIRSWSWIWITHYFNNISSRLIKCIPPLISSRFPAHIPFACENYFQFFNFFFVCVQFCIACLFYDFHCGVDGLAPVPKSNITWHGMEFCGPAQAKRR